MTTHAPDDTAPSTGGPSGWTILALAIATGVTVANIYYAQPLIGDISRSFGLDLSNAGLIVTTLQLGYVAGLIFLVPLGDLIENRLLILLTLGGVLISLLLSALAPNAALFIAASLVLGFTTTATQMIVPVVAHLSPEHRRGQIVGTVMSGLLIGILLARPVATLIAGPLGWRGVYAMSAVALCAVIVLIAKVLPRRHPAPSLNYGALIFSLWDLLKATHALQKRAAYHALLFAAFSVFWSGVPLVLQAPPFSLGHLGLSAFLLSGVAGALVAPIAGRLADRGYIRAITGVAILTVAISFMLTWFGGHGSLAAFVAAGIVLDAGVQANLVAGQRVIYTLRPDIRSRLNALYLAIFFFGGAIGSALTGYALAKAGTDGLVWLGLVCSTIAALLFGTDLIRGRPHTD